mgnify:FL=1
MNHLLCFGFGFSASALAQLLSPQGWRITGTSRSAEGEERIRSLGFEAARFDGTAPSGDVTRALETASHLLISAPPSDDGDPVLAHHRADIVTANGLRWIGYLSTIGVYGDHGGAWVDETTPETPLSDRSKRRLAAEQSWRALTRPGAGPDVQVFRLAGIYGPGRSAIDQVRAGRARRIVSPGQVFNRIHVDDIAGTLAAAIATGGTHTVYNVTDDEPAPPQDVIGHAAKLLGVPAPPELPIEEAELSPMAQSFYSELKRVRNDRIKQDLGVRLCYPTYREGLAAVLEGSGGSKM